MPEEPQNTRRVGVYDRPASADRPRSRGIVITVIVIVLIVAVIWYLRTR